MQIHVHPDIRKELKDLQFNELNPVLIGLASYHSYYLE